MDHHVSRLAMLRRFQLPSVWAVRTKTQRFKPKIAAVRQTKTPSMLALDHFDFYYGPLYGPKHWPSIRLGLLSPNKFIAVLNRLSTDNLTNEAILRDLSTIELIEQLTAGKKVPKSQKDALDEAPLEEGDQRVNEEKEANLQHDENLASRLEEGMGEFRQSEGQFTYGEVQLGMTSLEKRRLLEKDIQITGLEHVGQKLNTIDETIIYPRELKLFTYSRDDISDFPSPMKDKNGISSWWLLDGGSVVPVLALNLKAGESILDLCAAPGGKSLLMAQIGNFAKLVCNDGKMSRLGQLRRGLSMYIPVTSDLNERIVLKRKDASNLDNWDEENVYDKVLLDAPCSTDRLAVNQDEGNMFSIGMTQERLDLPQLQTKLLINALRAVKVGGSVVYSTCTLSPIQNESVVGNAAALVRQHFGIEVVEQSLKQLENQLRNTLLFRFADKCQRGTMIVPNIRSNYGPMYVCKLLRTR